MFLEERCSTTCAKQQQQHKKNSVYIAGWGSASFLELIKRGADAAQVCSDVGFVAVAGPFECRFANAVRQIVSER